MQFVRNFCAYVGLPRRSVKAVPPEPHSPVGTAPPPASALRLSVLNSTLAWLEAWRRGDTSRQPSGEPTAASFMEKYGLEASSGRRSGLGGGLKQGSRLARCSAPSATDHTVERADFALRLSQFFSNLQMQAVRARPIFCVSGGLAAPIGALSRCWEQTLQAAAEAPTTAVSSATEQPMFKALRVPEQLQERLTALRCEGGYFAASELLALATCLNEMYQEAVHEEIRGDGTKLRYLIGSQPGQLRVAPAAVEELMLWIRTIDKLTGSGGNALILLSQAASPTEVAWYRAGLQARREVGRRLRAKAAGYDVALGRFCRCADADLVDVGTALWDRIEFGIDVARRSRAQFRQDTAQPATIDWLAPELTPLYELLVRLANGFVAVVSEGTFAERQQRVQKLLLFAEQFSDQLPDGLQPQDLSWTLLPLPLEFEYLLTGWRAQAVLRGIMGPHGLGSPRQEPADLLICRSGRQNSLMVQLCQGRLMGCHFMGASAESDDPRGRVDFLRALQGMAA